MASVGSARRRKSELDSLPSHRSSESSSFRKTARKKAKPNNHLLLVLATALAIVAGLAVLYQLKANDAHIHGRKLTKREREEHQVHHDKKHRAAEGTHEKHHGGTHHHKKHHAVDGSHEKHHQHKKHHVEGEGHEKHRDGQHHQKKHPAVTQHEKHHGGEHHRKKQNAEGEGSHERHHGAAKQQHHEHKKHHEMAGTHKKHHEGTTKHKHEHAQKKQKIQSHDFLASHLAKDSNAKSGEGCHGVDIHAVAKQEPNPAGICINDPDIMPRSWQPPHDYVAEFNDPGGPWTEAEQALADQAVHKGLEELVGWFEQASDRQIKNLHTDATNSLFDYVLGSHEMPEFHQKALTAAIKVLKISAEDFAEDDSVECKDMWDKTGFVGYAQRLSLEDPNDKELHKLRDALIQNLEKSMKECGSLDAIMRDGVKVEGWRQRALSKNRSEDEVYTWFMWVVGFTTCMGIPELEMPSETEEFIATIWKYFKEYGLSGYDDYKEADDPRATFIGMAYIATHLLYIPTGYGRHYGYVRDAPYLYQYYRENFYRSITEGGHDLAAEFVDAFMVYGCTPENDVMVRHGFRYMLHLYKESGHSFVKQLEDGQSEEDLSDYDRIHKPWTGISSLMTQRCYEPEVAGSYGDTFRKALQTKVAVI